MSHAPNSVLIPVVPSAPNEEIEIYEDDPPAYQEVIPAVEGSYIFNTTESYSRYSYFVVNKIYRTSTNL